ncbi:MAG: hypothetical protein ACOCXH_03250 [Cyclobacteriaceae bacterium]
MSKINFKKHILPHLIAILVFIVATIILYSPVYFENKQVSQHDVQHGVGGGQELIEYREQTGEEGLWTNSMFSGMPGYLINVQWTGNLLEYVKKLMYLGLPYTAKHTFLAMLCFYIMLLAFGVRPYLAVAGGLSFGLSSFFVIGISAGHIWRMVAIAYMPLVLAGIHLTFKGNRWLGLGLTALALGLQIGAKHPQMTYYLLIMVIIYGLVMFYDAIKQKTIAEYFKIVGLLVIAAILAIGANLGYLWTTYEYSQYSMRGPSEISLPEGEGQGGLERDYAFNYSNSILEPLTMLVPNIMGGSSQESLSANSNLGEKLREQGLTGKQLEQQLQAVPTYWGKQPLTAPYYLGAIIFFAFILSLFNLNNHIKTWILISVILSIILSWGSNFASFNNLVFDILPGYNKFRSVTFTIIIAFIAIPLAGMIGIENWLKEENKQLKQKQLLQSAAITGGFLLFIILVSFMLNYKAPIDERIAQQVPNWFINALREDRASMMRTDAFRSLVFIFLAAGVLWAILKEKISGIVGITAIVLITGIDLLLVDSRYLKEENFSRKPISDFAQKTPADEKILADKEQFRVLNLQNPFNEARTSYYHSSIGGYHGAKIRRYQDLIDNCISGEIETLFERLRAGNQDFSDLAVLNMLNARYFYAGESANNVFRNPNALGNAWLVNEIIEVENPDRAIGSVCEINPAKEAIVNTSQFSLQNSDFTGTGTIELLEYQPNQLTYQANVNGGAALAIFSEVFYPLGWEAFINGEPADYIRVNYILRGMELPAGEHTIEFRFRPDSYYVGNKIMLAASSLIILLFLGSIFIAYKRT